MHLQFLKIFFSRISKPNSIKLDTNSPWMKGIQDCSNKVKVLFKGEIITKCKTKVGDLKIFSRNNGPNLIRLGTIIV
jgi:hypothetical protein